MGTSRLHFPEPGARVWRLLALAAATAGAALIASTYFTFSGTYDEPAHLAAGIEWLSTGRYTYEPAHPPLGRVAAAIGPYLNGVRTLGVDKIFREGTRLLGTGEHYRTTLALARLGELPFFLLICWIAWSWSSRLTDERGGALAVLFVAANPNLLAHGGLATTDIAVAATVPLAMLAAERWLQRPDSRSSVLLGAALAAAGLSKFSALVFLAPALLGAYAARAIVTRDWLLRERGGVRSLALGVGVVAVTAMLAVWAAYRFDVGAVAPGSGLVVPAPAFFRGIADFARHGADGHPAFLLGQISDRGWWYYYPVAFLAKTPLPLLFFGCVGAIVAGRMVFRREAWRPALPLIGVAAVLLVASTSRVDIGVRLVLPVYPLLAVLASLGAISALERAASVPVRHLALRLALPAVVALWIVEPIREHPDHLAYFSPLAGPNPERVLVDSNLDWGQDLYRLAAAMRELQIDSIRVAYFGSANLHAAGLTNARQLFPGERPTGWIAASETLLAGAWVGDAYAWLQAYTPVRRIGRSMRLYYVPAKVD